MSRFRTSAPSRLAHRTSTEGRRNVASRGEAGKALTSHAHASAPSQASSGRRANPFDQRDESPANQYGGGGYGGGASAGSGGFGGYGQSTYNQPSQYGQANQYSQQAPYDPPSQYQQQGAYGGGGNNTYQVSYPCAKHRHPLLMVPRYQSRRAHILRPTTITTTMPRKQRRAMALLQAMT